MTRCKYCHTDHILDAKGRCPSCADAGDVTAYGLHYGDYMAAKPRPYVLPVSVTPLRDLPVMNPEKVCRICGKPIPPESGRRTLCSLECQAEFNRQSAKAAKEKPLRPCAAAPSAASRCPATCASIAPRNAPIWDC